MTFTSFQNGRGLPVRNSHGGQKMRRLFGLKQGAVALAAVLSLGATDAQAGFNWGGRLKQGISVALDQEGGPEIGPTNYVIELNTEYKIGRTFSINGDFWLRGDHFSQLRKSDGLIDRGIQSFSSPNFLGQHGFRLNKDRDVFSGDVPYGEDSQEVLRFDKVRDIIRDFSVTWRTKNRSVKIKLGKFQRGWGQSDGLRLIDLLNAQDFRSRFALGNPDEIRIPQTGVAVDLDFKRLGIDRPFSWIGMNKPAFEVVYYPEVQHSQFIVNNPTPSDQTAGGIFGFPFPALIDPVSGRGDVYIGANLHDIEHKQWDWLDGELGLRFTFRALNATWTVNALYGYQDLPVVTLRGGTLIVGNAYNDPSNSILNVPLTRQNSILATWGPGMYIQQLRAFSGTGSFNILGLGGLVNNLTGLLGNVISGVPLTPFACSNIQVVGGCSVNFDFNLDYDYRQRVLGFSMTREMKEIGIGRKDVSPVIRIEAAIEKDKPFNNMVTMNQFTNQANGSAALIASPEAAISRSDQINIMLGFDFPLWVPFWKTQRNSIFTSFQFFNYYTVDHENKVYQAPYMFTELEKHQRYITFLWIGEFFKESLVLEGLVVWDISKESVAYRQRIDLNMFGDNIRPRIEWIHVHAEREEGALGFIHDADILEVSITYQF